MSATERFGLDELRFMRLALQEAQAAREAGEVPVGAVVVRDGQVLATGRNRSIATSDPTAHAEVVALRTAAEAVGNYRLDGCDLYVTLEPCPMCSGAMLHARLRRVFYGAPDPRTGTAGSVLDLFSLPQLNHRTCVRGGLLAAECGALLQAFFQEKRRAPIRRAPLREDALRTPEHAFALVPTRNGDDPSYLQDAPALEGLRMHYRDSRPDPRRGGAIREDAPAWLCLHGPGHWSQRFDSALRGFAAAGMRAVAPDLIGFGRSDKPKRETFHATAWHAASLQALVEKLDLQGLVVVAEEGSRTLAHRLVATDPARYRGLAFLQEPGPDSAPVEAWHADAPFPDRGHRAGPRALGHAPGHRVPGDSSPAPASPVPTWPLDIDRSHPEDDTAWLARVMEYFVS